MARFENATSGFAVLAVDPSRGSLLNALTDTPNFQERIQQGGYVGYTIIGLGIVRAAAGAGPLGGGLDHEPQGGRAAARATA